MKRIILVIALFVCLSSRVSFAQTNQTYWWNNSVFYELFVRSFYDTNGNGKGDFNGITQKLGYLDSLGIKAIWVMPINLSPSYHGYDVSNYYGVNPDYGTTNDFKAFLSAAHSRGIKVIIDWVMNHSSNQHNWFKKSAASDTSFYRDFYRWSSTVPSLNTGPFGSTLWHKSSTNNYYYGLFDSSMPDLNYNYQPVKDSMFATAKFWLDSMHVDGFRLDAALYIFENGDTLLNASQTFSFWHDFRTMYKAANPEAMAVGEAWLNGYVPIPYVTNDRLDFCFEFNQAASIINAVNNGSMGSLKTEINSVYNAYPYLQYGSFLTNHDQDRVMYQLGDNLFKAKGAAAIYLTIPGIPFVYYGEEIGMDGEGPDQDKRTPMQWSSGAEAGFSTTSPWESINSNYKTVNAAVEKSDPNSLLNWYKKLIALRNTQPALQTGSYTPIASNDKILAFLRTDSSSSKTLLVLINTTGTNYPNQSFDITASGFSSPFVQLHNLIDSSNSYATMQGSTIMGVKVPAYNASIYELSVSTGIENIPVIHPSITLLPNPVADELHINIAGNITYPLELKIFDETGRLIKHSIADNLASFDINVQGLTGGFYILQLSNQTLTVNQQFVKE